MYHIIKWTSLLLIPLLFSKFILNVMLWKARKSEDSLQTPKIYPGISASDIFNKLLIALGPVYMIPLARDWVERRMILRYGKKSFN
mgnify:CR=1 FL=1